jgi:hypothetical protein
LPGEEHPTGCASTILLVTSIYLSLGVVAFVGWGATGNIAWVVSFFAYGALLLVSLALIELWLALRVRQHFQPGDVLHMACILDLPLGPQPRPWGSVFPGVAPPWWDQPLGPPAELERSHRGFDSSLPREEGIKKSNPLLSRAAGTRIGRGGHSP